MVKRPYSEELWSCWPKPGPEVQNSWASSKREWATDWQDLPWLKATVSSLVFQSVQVFDLEPQVWRRGQVPKRKDLTVDVCVHGNNYSKYSQSEIPPFIQGIIYFICKRNIQTFWGWLSDTDIQRPQSMMTATCLKLPASILTEVNTFVRHRSAFSTHSP